jgi:lipid-A-disaccharide synthase
MDDNILIIAGEPSGDMRAGELLKELRGLLPSVSFWGIGGDHAENAGMELIEHVSSLSVVGAMEVIRHLPAIRRQYSDVVRNVRLRKPRLAILVDYPGFNLRVARFLKSEGIPVVFYIIPQVWAWGRGRIRVMRECIDKALVLFDFEETFMRENGIDAEFVGHPLADMRCPSTASGHERERIVALLPGSRESEVRNALPVMLAAAGQIRGRGGDISFVLAKSSNVTPGTYASALAPYAALKISSVTDDTAAALSRSVFAVVTSGTATLEAAICGVPLVIVYRTALLTYIVARSLMRVPFLGLVNLIAGKGIVPELLQNDFTPKKLSDEVLSIMNDPERLSSMKRDLLDVKNALGEKGGAKRAAEAIRRFLEERTS